MIDLQIVPSSATPSQHVDVLATGCDPTVKFAITTRLLGVAGSEVGLTTNTNRSRRDGSFAVGIKVPPGLTAAHPAVISLYQRGVVVASAQVPLAVAGPPPTYAAEWRPQGGDETTRFQNFLNAAAGKRVAVYGDTGVRSARTSVKGAEIDFLDGAMLHAMADIPDATLIFADARAHVRRAKVKGRGYGTYHPQLQWQHGIAVYGGSAVILDDPDCSDTFGDGIKVDVETATQAPPAGIVINRPLMARNCRNGITLNAGQTLVQGGSIAHSGLHNIDMEPNGDREALSLRATIADVSLATHGEMAVFDTPGQNITGFAIAGGGYSHAPKPLVDIQRCKADQFTVAIGFVDHGVFRDNESVAVIQCPNGQQCRDTAFLDRWTVADIANNKNMSLNTVYPFFGA